MADVDCVEMLVVAGVLYEDLVVQVVLVLGHKDVNVTHDFQNVQTLEEFQSIRYINCLADQWVIY